jgi:hypothetical protein
MPITNTAWVRAHLCKLQKGCTRLAAASDKINQLLAHGRWFSPGTLVSSIVALQAPAKNSFSRQSVFFQEFQHNFIFLF